MVFKEKLTWILDQQRKSFIEQKYQINIDFVHSLGKKCDCVGWSVLNMDEPDADYVLDEIQRFCTENGWTARGWYKRTYPDIASDWFELKASPFKDDTFAGHVTVPGADGKDISLAAIRAYHETTRSPKEFVDICVSERFRNACIKHNIQGIDFCWVQDTGKYDAGQWFYIYPHKQIPRIACDRGLYQGDTLKLQALGGALPKIASVFTVLQHITLPDCYLAEDLPSGGIAYAYCPITYSYSGRNNILIHKTTAQILIAEKALSQSDLRAVCVLDACPEGYTLDKTEIMPRPTDEYMAQSIASYEKTKSIARPIRSISEKEALKVFRKAKTQRKEDFQKKLDSASAEAIAQTQYKLLLPYYQIANGGQLSDEYAFLPYDQSVRHTETFYTESKKEELAQIPPSGIVFAVCTDGDSVLVTEDTKVIRFSHEAPESTNEWPTVAQFFFDAICEAE